MDKSRQTQSAGDNSTQMQAGTINYNVTFTGIDEAAARRICQQEYAIARQNWTEEAIKIADDRARQLENKLMPKMIEYDSTLSIFADPAFQLTIREAQISAATSERKSDYEMLSELVLHRAEHNHEREKRLGVSKAIEIVSDVSTDAMIALSVVYAMGKYSPVTNDLEEGLTLMNQIFESIINSTILPEGNEWIEHLGLLTTIRISPAGIAHFNKLKDCLPQIHSQYLVSGVLVDSEEYSNIMSEFNNCGLPTTCLVSHPLKPGFVKLNNSLSVDDMRIIQQSNNVSYGQELNDDQKKAMRKAISILRKDESNNKEMIERFMTEWDKYSSLKTIHKWWDSLSSHFTFTPSGEALANAYIRTRYPSIPSLY